MSLSYQTRAIAFEGPHQIAVGELHQVALKVKDVLERGASGPVLIFNESTSDPIEVDFRGTRQEVFERLTSTSSHSAHGQVPLPEVTGRGRGRPRLGVVAREVTLLPRHWDWLNSQPGGASVALRKLVEDARRSRAGGDQKRRAEEATYRFISAMAGDAPGFEEATRALFVGRMDLFNQLTQGWPQDIGLHARQLAAAVRDPVV